MTNETLYALVDANGLVFNIIVADQKFIDSGLIEFNKAVNITTLDSRPSVGWTHVKNERFTPPTQEEIDATVAQATAQAEAQIADDEFLSDVAIRLRKGDEIAQAERDRLLALQLTREVLP